KCINLETKKFLQVCDPPNLLKDTFIKIRNKKSSLFILSQKGVLMSSTDYGQTWKLVEFLNTSFRDFAIIDENTLILVQENGDVLKYTKNTSVERIVLKTQEKEVNLTRVRFYDSNLGFLLDTNGTAWMTKDGGINFYPYKLGSVRLEDIVIINDKEYFVVGERGSIFKSLDGGLSWKSLPHKNISFTKAWYLRDENNAYFLVLNNFDQILISSDGGVNWKVSHTQDKGSLLSMAPINPKFGLKALHPNDDEEEFKENQNPNQKEIYGDILAVGQFSKISTGDITGEEIKWYKISGGDSIYSPYSILNFIIPLIAIWIFFLMLYTLIPNTNVPIRTGMAGALITSILFLLFIYAFGVYIKSFSTSTMIIYRALAAVPLFLLFIYGSCMIVLYGAEITATLQFKKKYIYNDDIFAGDLELEKYHFYKLIEILAFIYQEQKNNRKPIKEEKLVSRFYLSEFDLKKVLEKLNNAGYLISNEIGEIAAVVPSDELDLHEVYKLTISESFLVPPGDESNLAKHLEQKFTGIEKYSEEQLKGIKFSHLI
ncbi:MAG: YihY/virulence factor BrkB family protein, partial [Leptospiraceae bacterium]|nr:YihY/virulence factor BrkB family protein [Leptospiraceae bacterium]